MKQYLAFGLVAAAAVFVGGFLALHFGLASVQTGGDFPGGIVPNQLWTAATSTNTVTPVGSFGLASANGLYVGGTASANQVNLVGVATTSVGKTTLGAINTTTSTVTSTITLPLTGFAVGDPCWVGLSSATNTDSFGADANVTAVGSSNATITATFWNGSASALTVVTGTARAVCVHTAL